MRTTLTVAGLLAALLQAQLGQIAIAIDSLSGGKGALMLGAGVDANPRTGRPVRQSEHAELPFVTVYPASSPAHVDLKGVGKGKILGAIRLSVPTIASNGKGRAEEGVYMLFLPDSQRTVGLVSVDVDAAGHMQAKTALQTPLDPVVTSRWRMKEPGRKPVVMASFPAAEEVTDARPPQRVGVYMEWDIDDYTFSLDIDTEWL